MSENTEILPKAQHLILFLLVFVDQSFLCVLQYALDSGIQEKK